MSTQGGTSILAEVPKIDEIKEEIERKMSTIDTQLNGLLEAMIHHYLPDHGLDSMTELYLEGNISMGYYLLERMGYLRGIMKDLGTYLDGLVLIDSSSFQESSQG